MLDMVCVCVWGGAVAVEQRMCDDGDDDGGACGDDDDDDDDNVMTNVTRVSVTTT